MSHDITYGEYLRLPQLLACQRPLTGEHDELLFVILHQTMELWMKQTLHEIAAAQAEVRAGNLVPAYKHLARVSRIQAVMTQTWDILSTMTPADYLNFRGSLGTSSGFQSAQFRTLEYRLGIKDPMFLRFQPEGSVERAAMEDAFAAPTLYDDVLAQLAKPQWKVEMVGPSPFLPSWAPVCWPVCPTTIRPASRPTRCLAPITATGCSGSFPPRRSSWCSFI